MNNNLTLVVLAGGMGSRFGGLKQIEPVGPNGEFIIDYSIYDAIKAGFNKVIFIIKEEHLDIFKRTIEERISKYIKVEYSFQNDERVKKLLETREKPLGTAHAILCTKDKINEPFLVINADDFYGRNAYLDAAKFLKFEASNDYYGIITYPLVSTLPSVGIVKRGVCLTYNGLIEEILESKIETVSDGIIAYPLDGSAPFKFSKDTNTSMNMLCLTPSIFNYLEKDFKNFLDKSDLKESEYLIPDALRRVIQDKFAKVKNIKTNSTWIGMTYKEDKKIVEEKINDFIKQGIYPNKLW